MRADQRKHHFIYKTTCLITGKWYVGMHSTDKLDDGYVGSGKRLWYSLKKHGKENHKCEILEMLADRKSLTLREQELVNEELLSDPMCLNLAPGGEGGMTRMPRTDDWKAKISAAHMGKKQDPEQSKRHSEKMKGRIQTAESVAARVKGFQSSEKFKARRRAVIIDGVIYESGCHAVEVLGIAGSTLHHRIKSPNWIAYQWADDAPKDPALVSARARGPYCTVETV